MKVKTIANAIIKEGEYLNGSLKTHHRLSRVSQSLVQDSYVRKVLRSLDAIDEHTEEFRIKITCNGVLDRPFTYEHKCRPEILLNHYVNKDRQAIPFAWLYKQRLASPIPYEFLTLHPVLEIYEIKVGAEVILPTSFDNSISVLTKDLIHEHLLVSFDTAYERFCDEVRDAIAESREPQDLI